MTLEVTRLDHHGIVAGIIKDLNIIGLIDEKISTEINGITRWWRSCYDEKLGWES